MAIPGAQDSAGHALGNARRHGQDGRQGRKHHHEVASAQTNSHEVRHHDADGRPDADYKYRIHQVAISTARPPPSCQPVYGDNGWACTATSRSEGRRRCSPATNTLTSRDLPPPSAASHAKAINAFTNPDQFASAWSLATKPWCCSPTPRVNVGRLPHPLHHQPKAGSKCVSRPDGQSLSRLCGDARQA